MSFFAQIEAAWKKQFPYGLLVTKESLAAQAANEALLMVPDCVLDPIMKEEVLVVVPAPSESALAAPASQSASSFEVLSGPPPPASSTPSPASNMVLGGLHIGALWSVCNQAEVYKRNIGAIINVANGCVSNSTYDKSVVRLRTNFGISYARITWLDGPSQVLAKEDLSGLVAHMHVNRLEGRGVLVHCVMGRSRSSALVVAYLLALQKDKNPDECLKQLQACREVAMPNDFFMQQLREYHAEGFFKSIVLEETDKGDVCKFHKLAAVDRVTAAEK